MTFLEALAALRSPVFDAFFLLVTRLGEEFLYMAVALAVFWCGRKSHGYFLLTVGFVGTVCNQFLKLFFRVPRPWIKNPDFQAVEAAIPAATGYSFPSGHTQIATGLYGGIARLYRHPFVRTAGIAIVLLVAFSRMYLGVHTPLDVLVSLAIGTLLVFLLAPFFARVDKDIHLMYKICVPLVLLAAANLLFVHLYPFPLDADMENVKDGIKNAWSLFGAILALPIVCYMDNRFIRFSGQARPLVQILKVAVGLLLVLAVKEGLKFPLNLLPGGANGFSSGIRYFFVVLVAGVGYPALFRFLPQKWVAKKSG